MAINQPISSPVLRVFQVQRNQNLTFTNPSLGSFIIGSSYEIRNAFNDDGTLNSNVRLCGYNQLPQLITKSAFPSPRLS